MRRLVGGSIATNRESTDHFAQMDAALGHLLLGVDVYLAPRGAAWRLIHPFFRLSEDGGGVACPRVDRACVRAAGWRLQRSAGPVDAAEREPAHARQAGGGSPCRCWWRCWHCVSSLITFPRGQRRRRKQQCEWQHRGRASAGARRQSQRQVGARAARGAAQPAAHESHREDPARDRVRLACISVVGPRGLTGRVQDAQAAARGAHRERYPPPRACSCLCVCVLVCSCLAAKASAP